MASKSKKSATADNPIESTRATSPLYQTLVSRKQEKRDLQNLNDRLAQYIERNRQLENENFQLIVEARTAKESVTREINKHKSVFEKEIKDLRSSLDDIAKAKAKNELEINRLSAENDDIGSK